ncbi:hypothetical protein [Janibacter sp. GXQ6167]|uniref:hypothetical protein n=1 Tax=Janibacter sp. GXQ6167 TaxID=3240791 RepID=UPI003525C2D4
MLSDPPAHEPRFGDVKRGALKTRLAGLQRRCEEAGIPVLVQIDGWESSGKGYVLTHLLRDLDPRATSVHVFEEINEEDRRYPPSWRYWRAIPADGEIAVFDRSVYTALMNRLDLDETDDEARLAAFAATERALTDAGMVVVKVFLDIERAEQARRIKEYSSDEREVLIGKRDRWQNKRYKALSKRFSDVLSRSNFPFAPWHIIDADDRKQASIEVLGVTCEAIEAALAARQTMAPAPPERAYGVPPSIVEQVDLTRALSDDDYDDVLGDLQREAGALAYRLADAQIATVLVFEGMDAAGKGGAIRRLVKRIDPRLLSLNPTAAPSDMAKEHHYLWRFYNNLPARGQIAVFDRSWYGRVMVERVEGFAEVAEWDRSYGEINAMEKEFTDDGGLLLKFFLYIDPDEQLARFEARERDKPWKLTEEDWRNREKWDEYVEAVDEMLGRTSPANAPWTVVAGNDKQYARVEVLRTFIAAASEALDARESGDED